MEPGVAIVASSLVTIRPLLRQMRFKGFESSERSRSRGLWGRHGGGGGRSTGLSGNNNGRGINSKGQWSQVPSENLKLKDLEAGYADSLGGKGGGGPGGKAGGNSKGVSPSRETTLCSRASTQTNGPSGGKSWGRAVAITLREDSEQEHGQAESRNPGYGVGVAVTKDGAGSSGISPVVASSMDNSRPGHGYAESDSSGESVFVIEGAKTVTSNGGGGTSRSRTGASGGGHRTTTTTWRDETPQSLEESEGIQGLRYPVPAVRRTADDGE